MYRFRLWVLCIAVCILCIPVFAQVEETGLAGLDFNAARISFAGPSAFLVRDVRTSDGEISVVFRLDAQGVWKVTEVIPQGESAVPTGLILDFATISVNDEGKIVVDGMLLDGNVYKTEITVNPDTTLGIPSFFTTGTMIGSNLSRVLEEYELVARSDYDTAVEERDSVRDELSRLGALVNRLQNENAEFSEEIVDLEGQVNELAGEREAMIAELVAARNAFSELQERNSILAQEIEELRTRTEADTATAADPVGTEDSESMTASVNAVGAALLERIGVLEGRVAELSARIADLQTSVSALPVADAPSDSVRTEPDPVVEIDSDLDELLSRIQELQRVNNLLTQERNDIETELRERVSWQGYLALVRGGFVVDRLAGFGGAVESIGTWVVSQNATAVVQTDQQQFFARLDLPLEQTGQAFLYRFSGRSTGHGWAGYGIHIFAGGSRLTRGYGFGESLLIWLTRDPEVYGTDQTYLEVYRSHDDVNMERVLHAAVEEPIDRELAIEVLYEPRQEYITIAVNGEEKIRYKTWFGIDAGVQVALRSLGTAEFSDLSVSSRAAD